MPTGSVDTMLPNEPSMAGANQQRRAACVPAQQRLLAGKHGWPGLCGSAGHTMGTHAQRHQEPAG